MSTAHRIATVNKYVEAFARKDIGLIREIFADNATVEDPVGTDVHKGIAAICAFYEGSFGADARLSLTGPVRCAGNAAAFAFEVHVGGMKIEVIDVFEFDAAGKVVSMKAYWGKENISQ